MVVDQCELESLPFESAAFGRIVRDGTIDKALGKVIHPARNMLDLVDFCGFESIGSFQVLDVSSVECFVSHGRQPRECINSGIFTLGNVGDCEASKFCL